MDPGKPDRAISLAFVKGHHFMAANRDQYLDPYRAAVERFGGVPGVGRGGGDWSPSANKKWWHDGTVATGIWNGLQMRRSASATSSAAKADRQTQSPFKGTVQQYRDYSPFKLNIMEYNMIFVFVTVSKK